MKINNSEYGGFVVSKNILKGIPIAYSFREKATVENLNGWTIYSANDSDEYVNDPKNFTIINATTIYQIAPVILEIYHAPYGTDLYWNYHKNIHTGFYDLKDENEIAINEIRN